MQATQVKSRDSMSCFVPRYFNEYEGTRYRCSTCHGENDVVELLDRIWRNCSWCEDVSTNCRMCSVPLTIQVRLTGVIRVEMPPHATRGLERARRGVVA